MSTFLTVALFTSNPHNTGQSVGFLNPVRLAIKAPALLPDDENSLQSHMLKTMQERFENLHDEISYELSYSLIGVEQNSASLENLSKFEQDMACLIQRSKGESPDFYQELRRQYEKDAEKFEKMFQAASLEPRPENLGLLLRKYAQQNGINVIDFVAIGEFAANNDDNSLVKTEQKGIRDVLNFMQNPISRKTFECFCESASRLEEIEFSDTQIQTLRDLLTKAQDERSSLFKQETESKKWRTTLFEAQSEPPSALLDQKASIEEHGPVT